MEISLIRRYGYAIVIRADNVNIEEDIEDREYANGPDGKIDWSKPPTRDIRTDAIRQIADLLDDLIYYREKEYDSSELIKRLFDKLPESVTGGLLAHLRKQWDEYEE